MHKRINQFMLLFVILAVVFTSAVRTTPVYADDGSTEPPTEESAPAAEAGDTSTEETAATKETIEPAEEVPVSTPEIPGQASEQTEAAESPTGEPTAEKPESVPEVLEQLPEDTALVVVNETGEVEPLVTAEAAEIVATADPMWCPEGVTPGDAGCTGSYGDFNSLITFLTANSTFTGPGVVWVEDIYSGQDDSQIVFDGAQLTGLNNNNLTIRGGWSGGNNTTITGTSLADVSMVFVNWTGNITIENFDIDNRTDNARFGLSIQNTGNVTLNNVSVTNIQENTEGYGDGVIIHTTGNVNINNSEFDHNHGNGLSVRTQGTIEVDTVSASFNTLTGAYLNSCLYGTVDPGLCAGTGTVNIFSSGFSDNYNGIMVDAGGGINVDSIGSNRNKLRGAFLQSADDDGTGDVTVLNSNFSDNPNSTGLNVYAGGNIQVNRVDAFSNNTGAILDTTYATGTINVVDSNFGIAGSGNDWTGLHAESGSTITLTNVEASANGTNGAYLEAEGDITVSGSTFDENVQYGVDSDPGLFALSSGGNITLNNVNARENIHGAGVVLLTNGAGTITVNGGVFNQNGTFGIQAGSEDGDITINNAVASFNHVKGAYLGTFSGDIAIVNSAFVENGAYGIYAFASQGNIELNLVTVLGSDGAVGPGADDLTNYGAVLVAGIGNVFVSNSSFNLNTKVGLKVVSGGQVNLTNVTADQNGGNGVEVYSITSAGPICKGEKPVNITVNIDGGTFTNNGGYGLMVKPGPGGALVFGNPSTFGGNALGDYLLDLNQEFEDCTCTPDPEEPPITKGPLIVDVPSTGGPTVEQDCDTYTGTILRLPDGTWVQVGCPFEGFSKLEEVAEQNLPGPLGEGIQLSMAIVLDLTDAQGNVILNEDGTVTINFVIPEDSRARGYSILFWDPMLNDGAGGWVELPLYEVGTSFPLNPADPNDSRTIISGVKQIGDVVSVTVDFSGVFALIEQ